MGDSRQRLDSKARLAHFFLYSFQNLNLKKNKRKHGTGLIKFLGTFTDKQGRI